MHSSALLRVPKASSFDITKRCTTLPYLALVPSCLLCQANSARTVAPRCASSVLKCRRKHVRKRTVSSSVVASASVSELWTAFQTSPARDIYATTFAAAGAVAWVKLFDLLAVSGVIDQKLSRKLVHMSAGPLFVLTWPLFSAEPYARFMAAIVPCLNALRLIAVGSGVVDDQGTVKAVSREGDRKELLRGPLYYVLVLMGTTMYYWRDSPVGLVAVCLMCGGDGMADVVGRRLGHNNPLPYNTTKSVAGSIAMFAGGFMLSMLFVLIFHQLGFFECDLASIAKAVAIVSLVATLIESLPINRDVDDNLSVPGIALLMGLLLIRTAELV